MGSNLNLEAAYRIIHTPTYSTTTRRDLIINVISLVKKLFPDAIINIDSDNTYVDVFIDFLKDKTMM